jgi:hypothetical protein
MLRRAVGLAVLTLAGLGLAAAPAGASFHLMKIREVFPNATGFMGDQTEFTVLQATAAGQNHLTNHRVSFFHADGTASGGCVFPSNPIAAANQQTYLAAQPQSAFSLTTDCPYAAGGDPLQATGGAVCWDNTHIDCMAYGTFNNSTALLPVGNPAPAPPPGMSLTRTIARGCPTALDDADDTNDSAADFSVTSSNPRNSTSPITEQACAPGVGVGGDPNTTIKKRPKNKSGDDSPTFKFKSDEVASTFKCKLDRKKFHKCKSPKTYHGLDPGKHSFKVEAIDADSNIDPTPAKDKFKILP